MLTDVAYDPSTPESEFSPVRGKGVGLLGVSGVPRGIFEPMKRFCPGLINVRVTWSVAELTPGMAAVQNHVHKLDVMAWDGSVVIVLLPKDASSGSIEHRTKWENIA